MKKLRFKVRNSRIQGLGAFAMQKIRKGTRLIEYAGERVTPKVADARYPGAGGRVLLFQIDKRTTIDAGVNGNEARFINHSCDPNCEAVVESRRIYIESIRTIQQGEELTYDYNLTRDKSDGPNIEAEYVCHCGAPTCRGTMLEPLPEQRTRRSKK